MKKFNAVLKKEYFETIRTKSFYILLGVGILLSLLSIAYVIIMNLIIDYLPQDSLGDLALFFKSNYAMSLNFFMSFMSTYFMITIIFMFAGSISKQIKNRQWLLPINAGISSSYLIAGKIVMSFLRVFFIFFVSALLHFLLTIILFSPDGMTIGNLMLAYASYLIYATFILIIVITLNAITKKMWVPSVIAITSTILLPNLLSAFNIFNNAFSTYTPFAFINIAMQPLEAYHYDFWQWFFAVGTTVLISALLIFWAIFSKKIKPEK